MSVRRLYVLSKGELGTLERLAADARAARDFVQIQGYGAIAVGVYLFGHAVHAGNLRSAVLSSLVVLAGVNASSERCIPRALEYARTCCETVLGTAGDRMAEYVIRPGDVRLGNLHE